MLARYAADSKGEHDARRELDERQHDQQVATGRDGQRPFLFDFESDAQQSDCLVLVERLLAPLDRGDEVAATFPCVAAGAQHMKLERRVCNARGHEHEHDGGGDEEQFTIEAHAYN